MIAVDTPTSKLRGFFRLKLRMNCSGQQVMINRPRPTCCLEPFKMWIFWYHGKNGRGKQRMFWNNHYYKMFSVTFRQLFRGLGVWVFESMFLLGGLHFKLFNWCSDFFLKQQAWVSPQKKREHFNQLMTWGGWNVCFCSRRDASNVFGGTGRMQWWKWSEFVVCK